MSCILGYLERALSIKKNRVQMPSNSLKVFFGFLSINRTVKPLLTNVNNKMVIFLKASLSAFVNTGGQELA